MGSVVKMAKERRIQFNIHRVGMWPCTFYSSAVIILQSVTFFLSLAIKRWIHLDSCWSTGPQQWFVELLFLVVWCCLPPGAGGEMHMFKQNAIVAQLVEHTSSLQLPSDRVPLLDKHYRSPFHTGEGALSLQRWFADSPLMVIHTKLVHVMMMASVCFQGVFQVSSCQFKPAHSL